MAKLEISAAHALHILEKAFEDKKITRADIDRYNRELHEEMTTLGARLDELRHAMEGAKNRVVSRVKKGVATVARASRKRVSAQVAASRRLQGQYIAAIRSVPKSRRAKYAKIAKEDGREKAIAAIKKNT